MQCKTKPTTETSRQMRREAVGFGNPASSDIH
jgi:hypothetical protein